jgi:hypothetical protein
MVSTASDTGKTCSICGSGTSTQSISMEIGQTALIAVLAIRKNGHLMSKGALPRSPLATGLPGFALQNSAFATL